MHSGQRYYRDNRIGIHASNLIGLFTLLAEPRGLQMLASTGRTSDAAGARRRYASTILHIDRWYAGDLRPGTSAWASLARVRRLHATASTQGQSGGQTGAITQTEIALTTFGFMG